MNQTDQTNRYYEEDEIRLIDYVYPIYRHRKFLVLFCLVVVILVGLYTFRMPKVYEAKGVILPETKQAGPSEQLKAAFLEQFGMAGLVGGAGTPAETFEAVLKSKELTETVLRRYNYFHLITPPTYKGRETAIKGFMSTVKVAKQRKEPTLVVTVQSDSPTFAADMANTFIIELDKYNRENSLTSTKRLRKYLEKRLETANRELRDVQRELREFQEKHRAISISEQATATLKVLSEMEAQRVALEVEKAAKEKFYKGPHIEIEQINAQMEALQKNIDRLTYSREPQVPVEREKGRVEFYIPLTQIPALSFDESRLLLKVKVKTKVVSMLATQLEQARLEETKDMPTINVLDWAMAPERPIKPKLKLNVILGFVVSLFVGIFLIFFLEYLRRMDEDPDTSPKWREIKQGLFKWKNHRGRS